MIAEDYFDRKDVKKRSHSVREDFIQTSSTFKESHLLSMQSNSIVNPRAHDSVK